MSTTACWGSSATGATPSSPRTFSLGALAGVGVGYDADILQADLTASGAVLPYWLAGLDGRWLVAGRWLVGVEVAWQNAAVLELGLTVGCRLGGGAS